MTSLQRLDFIKINAELLLHEFKALRRDIGDSYTQMNVTVPADVLSLPLVDQLCYVVGTNWNYAENQPFREEKYFTETVVGLRGSYTEQLLNLLRRTYTIGRVRFLTLKPHTSYSWHKDLEEYRLHIPMQTTDGSFFIWKEEDTVKVDSMSVTGGLYQFNTHNKHTAVNAGEVDRVHLVFNVLRR